MRLLTLFMLTVLQVHADSCLIRGKITDEDSDKPLPKAKVFAKSPAKKPAILRLTNEAGEFCFERLEPADYELIIERPGYLPFHYGISPIREKLKVDGQTELPPVPISMVPAASISGVVVDANGEPVENAEVDLSEKVWDHGWRAESVQNRETDDRGFFRFSMLAKGTFYLSVEPPETDGKQLLNEHGDRIRNVAVKSFYSGSATFERATPIHIEAGQNVANLVLTLTKAPARRFSGKLSPAVQIVPGAQPAIRIFADGGSRARIAIRKDGTFSADNLIPANYSLRMEGIDNIPGGVTREVDLTNGDLIGMVIEPEKTFDLRLTVRVEASSKIAVFPNLVGVDADFRAVVKPDANGSFFYSSVPAGVYRIDVERKDVYLKSVFIDGKRAPSTRINLRAGQPGAVEAVFSAKMARIEGSIENHQPSLTAAVVLVDDTEPKPELEGPTALVNREGKFKFESLAPGRYRPFAIEDFDDQLWGSPELAAALASKSVAFELHEDENKQLNVPLISATDWAAALKKIGL